ncbi:MAG: radical SAM protein, partial [Alphaproteobacteria bacterium]|nr:radical SAM protein [Alphaproteobacteria bacterium]
KKCLSNPMISRLTISGGDPLSVYNRMEVVRVCQEIRREFPSLEIWIYTGYTIEQLKQQSPTLYNELCKHADFIVDGRFDKNKNPTTKPFRGSDNQRVWGLKNDKEVLF